MYNCRYYCRHKLLLENVVEKTILVRPIGMYTKVKFACT